MNASPKTRRADQLFKALSDRTRLRILCLLRGGELCVCDLVTALRVPQPRASRHLSYLRLAGFVLARKEGYWTYYRLSRAASTLHGKLLESLDYCAELLPELTKDAAALRKCQGQNCC
jgi:ArsR family transcriptional regulator, arsenate/arsenite/antimonite-responsive transcriptional repressor